MKTPILTGLLALGSVVAACSGDNCANHVTGSWLGIGVPIETRMSLCQSFLRTTVKPPTTTVTATVTKYTHDIPDPTISSSAPALNASTSTAFLSRIRNQTVVPSAVPTFATAECPERGQFSSACACWASVTAETTTLSQHTMTATTTVLADVSCGPAATAVAGKGGGADAAFFPCSRQWGTCSCLLSSSKDEGESEVCVRVGSFPSGRGNMTSGPCSEAKECGPHGECGEGHICVFDGSCGCGKKRCYKAAPEGCDYQGLPVDESMLQRIS